MDLGAWVAAGRHRAVLDLIDQLPAHSRTTSAQMNDPEYVEAAMEARRAMGANTTSTPAGPDVRDWSPELAVLTQILDAVRFGTHANSRIHGGKGQAPKPSPTPTTEWHRAQERADAQDVADVAALFGFTS